MEGWIMPDIRTSALGGTPFGTSETRPANPVIGQTYYNGTLGVQEIYTASGWLPATGANDFNVTLNGPVTTSTFTKEYFAGAYTINSALVDSTYDIYVYDTAGTQVGYTKSPSLSATGNFNKIVVVGGSTGDLLSFSYKTTFTATNTTSQLTAGAFITSVTPTALNTIGDTTTVVGGNFASNVAVYFVGSDNIEIPAKSIVRTSSSELIITRPDVFSTQLGTYKVVVENPGITRPTGSSLHILNNAISPGTTPNWTTPTTLPEIGKNIAYNTTLVATDSEGTDIDYSIVSGTLPAGITLNNETGLLSGTYTGADFNTNNIVVRAVDTGGNTVDRTFTIFSSDPVWSSVASISFGQGEAVSYQLPASDNSAITYSIVSGTLPSGVTLNSSTGVLSGTTSSFTTSNVVFKATDASGNFTNKTFSIVPVYSSPSAAASAGATAGQYLFKSAGMTTPQLLDFVPSYYDSSAFVKVFSAPYGSTATINKIDLNIPMTKMLVQRSTLDLRGVARFSAAQQFNTTSGSTGLAPSSVGNNYGGDTGSMKVFLGNAGGHGIYNPAQSVCNWGSNISGSIGAGYDGTSCGSFPDNLRFGNANAAIGPTYANLSGTWEYWVTW
jgi:hypothetical protein